MKKAKFLLLTLLAVLGMNTAGAETVTPYEVDFEKAITTSNHDFAVASNWKHIVPTNNYDGYGPYYMSYSYSNKDGIGESGTLIAYRQYAGDNGGGAVVKDILVTPSVNGTVTMYVKPCATSASNPSFVEIYNVNADGTAIVGDYIQRFTEDQGFVADDTNNGWYTITLSLTEAKSIGIRAQYVYMDNFSATSAEIVPEKKLTIKSVADVDGASTTYFNQQEDGSILARYLVTLTNSGDIDLAPGDENYTLSLFNRNVPGTTYGAFPIPVALAVGETSEPFEMQVSLPADQAGWKYWDVKENISGTTKQGKNCGTNLYESKFIFDKAGTSYTNSSSATTTPIDFGKITENASVLYEIYNAGTAPLTINSITIDEPFTFEFVDESVNLDEGEIIIPSKGKITLLITFPIQGPVKDEPLASNSMRYIASSETPSGIYDGNIIIEYTNYGKEPTTYTLGVSGTIIDSSKNLITFDNGKTGDEFNAQFPAGSIHPDEIYISSSEVEGVTNYYLNSAYNPTKKFITPMLTATAGESFTYDAWGSGSDAAVIVYTSKDRINWTQVDKQTSSTLRSTPKTFIVTIEEAGDYYLAFELKSGALLDDIYGLTLKDLPEHDWYVMDSNLPTTATQNNPYTATISVKNINAEADAIATATLYVGGEAVAVKENVALEGNDKTAAEGTGRSPRKSNIDDPVEITLAYNPHTTGELVAYIELKTGDNVVMTEEVTLNIAKEVKSSEIAVGEYVSTTSNKTPFYGFDMEKGAYADFYFSKAQLETFGIEEGNVITAIKFKGSAYNKTIPNLTAEAWVGMESEATEEGEAIPFVAGNVNKEKMTHVTIYDGEQVTFETPVEMTIDLSENPLKWDGKSRIRIYTSMNGHGQYVTISWELDGNYPQQAYYSQNESTWSFNACPVGYFTLKIEEKTLSGTVTDEVTGEPIEGATVTIRNEQNDVEYTSTTDADGKYTIKVVQDELTYTATVEAEGYVTEEDDEVLSFEEGNLEYDFTLYPENPVYPSVTVTISDSEYATLYYKDYFLELPDGVKAYTAKVNGNVIDLTEMPDYIPAGEPVIINGPQGEYDFNILPMEAPVADYAMMEIAIVDKEETYNNGATIESENIKVVLGNDRNTKTYDVKETNIKSYVKNLFGLNSDKIAFVVGGNNPRGGDLESEDKSTGTTYNIENKVLPKSGCYYTITPETNGHFTAFIVLNNNKPLFVAKGSDGSCLLDSNGKPLYTVKKDGDEPTDVELAEDFTSAEKINGTVEFDVEAGETYYLFCTGSKLSFGGYVFESSFEDDSNNDLIGTEEDLTITDDADYKYYLLSWKDANKNKDELGFYFWKNSTDGHSMQLGAHKAYLKRPANAASNKGYVFWLPDAIEGITIEALTNADAIYTLSGIRVNANNLKKGIYIVNGKKVVIK